MDLAILSERFDNETRRLHEALEHHERDDAAMRTTLSGIDSRLRDVERMVWIATGGTVIIAALVGIIGTRLLHLLS